jgi:protein O-mannosyl-transferase
MNKRRTEVIMTKKRRPGYMHVYLLNQAMRPYVDSGLFQSFKFNFIVIIACSLVFISMNLSFAQNGKVQSSKGNIPVHSEENKGGTVHAVIIGISDYKTYPDLQFADKDAIAFYQLLLSDAFGAESNKVRLLLNEDATQNRVDEALRNLISNVQSGDRVFIYFSGHGGIETSLTTSRPGFLLTWESSQNSLRFTSFPLDYLNEIIAELSTANEADVFLITDACHSGKAEWNKYKGLSPVNEYISRITYGTSILSCESDQLSLEGEQWGGGRGLFSWHLVNGLAGKADIDKDGYVDLNEISYFVKERVKKEALPNMQNPVVSGNEAVLCKTDPKLMKQLDNNNAFLADASMKDFSDRGYEEMYINRLTENQKVLYRQFNSDLDKIKANTDSKGSVDFTDARKIYSQLALTDLPADFDSILRRKLIASLQDRPQQLVDAIISGKVPVLSDHEQFCTMAENLEYASVLMGKSHYLYSITRAKYCFFRSYCYLFDSNIRNDLNLRLLYLQTADSAIYYADNLGFLYNTRGNAKSDLEDYRGAITDYTKAIELDPKDPTAYNNMGNAKSRLQDFQGAVADYTKAIELDANDADVYNNRGNAKSDMQDYVGAIADYNKAIELNPDDAKVFDNRGIAKSDLQDFQGALTDFSQAIELDPEYTMAWNNRGVVKHQLQDYNGAISDYTGAIRLDSTYTLAWFNRGKVKSDLLDYQGAISDFSKAIELNPEDIDAYLNLSLAYYLQQNYNSAIRTAEKGLAVNPRIPELSDNLGYYYIEIESYDKAIESFKMCLKIVKNNKVSIDAILGLAIAYYNKKDKPNTKKYLLKAVSEKSCLQKGMEGLMELEKEGFTYTERNKETLKKIFGEFLKTSGQ